MASQLLAPPPPQGGSQGDSQGGSQGDSRGAAVFGTLRKFGRLRKFERLRALGALGVLAVLCLAAFTRLWALGRPDVLVFDELYYVRDAITQLAHGFPTVWPDDDPHMLTRYTDAASFAVHPPLGKWIIGIGLLAFGDGNGWGWRSGVAVCGVLTVAVTMRLGWRITGSIWVALLAGFILAIDGVHIVLSRVALLDGILTLFIVLGALFMWRDHETVVDRHRLGAMRPNVMWSRPWLWAAAAAFGLAASVKWSGAYPLAAFLLLTAAHDVWGRVCARHSAAGNDQQLGGRRMHHWSISAATQALVTGLITLPTAVAVYVASWWGWIVTADGWGRDEGPWPVALWTYHVDMFAWHSTLSEPHPYQSHPLAWPLGLRPTAMYEETVGEGFTAAISPFPNLLVTWGGVVALLALAWWILRRQLPHRASLSHTNLGTYAMVFVITGYLSGWLPWVLTFSRSAVFQFYTIVLTPFSALALAIVIAALCGWIPARTGAGPAGTAPSNPVPANTVPADTVSADTMFGRRVAAAMFLTAALIIAILFFPVWSGTPITDGFWRWHLWLPGWD